jgi:hypothetical protein
MDIKIANEHPSIDEAFERTIKDIGTFGLFRDIGIAILLRRYPRYVETLVTANHETERSFTDVEQRDV